MQFYRARRRVPIPVNHRSTLLGIQVLVVIYVGVFSTSAGFAAISGADAASIKGTVRAAASGGINARSPLLSGVKLTLVNRDFPKQVFTTLTDDNGSFSFINLPAAHYILTAESPGLPSVTHEIQLTEGASIAVEIVLTATFNESVTVRNEEGPLSTAETTTSNVIRSETLNNVPLREENYQSALPLTPGVVRGRDGVDHIKGARAGRMATQ
jgi:hypothetical protein